MCIMVGCFRYTGRNVQISMELVVLCRARRMLNPFRGVMQTIEASHVDAASVDGLRWGLYITDESAFNFIDLNSVVPFQSADVKYGEWTKKDGLVRFPSLPSMNQQKICERGEEILQMVQSNSSQVPFPLQDCYERWLLGDEDGLPVVLLESAYDLDGVTYNSNTLWRIGNSALSDFKTAEGDRESSAAEELQAWINRFCKRGRTVWVKRDTDGSGKIIARPGDKSIGKIEAGDFPGYGLRTQWDDQRLSDLVEEYLHWLSPWLLIMNVSASEEIEPMIKQAVQYPRRLFQIRRLLRADILERKEIKAALVQAELGRSK